VFEVAIRVKLTHLIKSCLKPEKKRKYGNKKSFYIKLHLEYRFGMKFTAFYGELTPEEALTSFTICNAYR